MTRRATSRAAQCVLPGLLLLTSCRSDIAARPAPPAPAWLLARADEEAELAARSTASHDFQFTDRRAPSGIAVACAFADIDNDGDPDLFVTTVRHGNRLFENQGDGTFRDITAHAGVGYVGHSSGAVFFDYDGDGLLDLLVINVGVYTNNLQR